MTRMDFLLVLEAPRSYLSRVPPQHQHTDTSFVFKSICIRRSWHGGASLQGRRVIARRRKWRRKGGSGGRVGGAEDGGRGARQVGHGQGGFSGADARTVEETRHPLGLQLSLRCLLLLFAATFAFRLSLEAPPRQERRWWCRAPSNLPIIGLVLAVHRGSLAHRVLDELSGTLNAKKLMAFLSRHVSSAG